MARPVAEFKDSEEGDLFVGKESAADMVGFMTKFLGDFSQLSDMFNKFKEDWREEYFEVLSAVTPLVEAPGETIEDSDEGRKVAERDVAADDEVIASLSLSNFVFLSVLLLFRLHFSAFVNRFIGAFVYMFPLFVDVFVGSCSFV
ncbi:hypothetical protein LIER_39110 [Lithospermum erythrorhizon]|uniref:Uncharacterized protein n=1 Tax=Lithospermum erythrorhizon TaxID=34254 RepID=A0AAV3QCA1_LITER